MPIGKDEFLCPNDAVADDMNFSRFGDAAEKDIGADPAGTPCSRCQRLSFLDDLPDEEVLWYDEQIYDGERF